MTHETHKTRFSDSSLYDVVCVLCGATDARGSDRLDKPCPHAWPEHDLTEYELRVLLDVCGFGDGTLTWGAAMSEAVERLEGLNLVEMLTTGLVVATELGDVVVRKYIEGAHEYKSLPVATIRITVPFVDPARKGVVFNIAAIRAKAETPKTEYRRTDMAYMPHYEIGLGLVSLGIGAFGDRPSVFLGKLSTPKDIGAWVPSDEIPTGEIAVSFPTEAQAQAVYGALMMGASGTRVAATPDDLESYYRRQIEWSRETFGPALRTKGVLQHIAKELKEIEAKPHDLSEWVDVMILAMDGFWRHGGRAEDLLPALLAKQAKNMARTWPDWRTMSEDSAIEHDRTGEATDASS